MHSAKVFTRDKAWLAGIVDGEGSLLFYSRLNRQYPERVFQVVITNTDDAILNEVKRIYDEWLISYSMTKNPNKLSIKTCFHIIVSRRNDACFILAQILPFLKSSKKDKAKLIMSFHKNFIRSDGKKNTCIKYHKRV